MYSSDTDNGFLTELNSPSWYLWNFRPDVCGYSMQEYDFKIYWPFMSYENVTSYKSKQKTYMPIILTTFSRNNS